MDNLKNIQSTLNIISQDPKVHISQIDNHIFDIIVDGDFDIQKINEIQKKIKESCSDEFIVKTFYCDEPYTKIIIRKK